MSASTPLALVDGPEAWRRLMLALVCSTIGGVGMWSVVVALPAVQAEFGASRADASLPYTLAMIGFAFGGVVHGRLADRYGIRAPLLVGAVSLGFGYGLAGLAPSLGVYALAHGLFIAMFGAAASFGPLLAHISLWFAKRRGIAVALCASGNYLAGAVWPPLVQMGIASYGWRATHLVIGAICILALVPIAFCFKAAPPAQASASGSAAARGSLGLSSRALMALICLAGVGCCVAMAMPQVHIVAYCSDLGYGVQRGAEMLSLMLGFGIVSRIASGFVADRIGGLATLLIGSVLQGTALLLYLTSDGLAQLYVISALFGLFQGGIVPMYAVIVREYFAPEEAATRVGIALMATLFGMAFGGWISGAIFDLTRSYMAAFANGILWNLLNLLIVGGLILRRRARAAIA